MLAATRKRGLSWKTDLGLCAPRAGIALSWCAGWAIWVALQEWVHPAVPATWANVDWLRIFALGVAGPVAEELAFRGVLFSFARRRQWSMTSTLLLTSVAWALLHIQYDAVQIGFIALDGLALGLARASSRSLFVPIAMHMGANLFSVAQSLGW
jgi:membrane protease YdiL (CAAX protease family)